MNETCSKTGKCYGKNMMMFTSFWDKAKTFKMMPVCEDSPYTEVIYNPSIGILVVISKIQKENFQFLPKLTDSGDVMPRKTASPDKPPYKEQRVKMNLLQEYYIQEPKEIIDFIKDFAVNEDSFDYMKFVRDIEKEKDTGLMEVERKPIVDAKGSPMVSK